MAEQIEKLSSMTDSQLKAYLFGNHFDQMSFIEVTAAYMQDLTKTEASSVKNISETMNTETTIQGKFADLDKAMNDEYVKDLQLQAEMSPSSMPDWLGDVVSGLMFLASIVTLNPVMIGMSAAMFAMNFTVNGKSLMSMMTTAAVGDDPTKRAEFEFGFAAGMALAGGSASALSGVGAAVEAGATAAEVAVQTLGQMVKYFFTYLPQGLMMDNFWPDFFQGVCKMSPEDAALLGMVVGITCGIASSAMAGASEDQLTQSLRNKMGSLSANAQQMFRYLMVGLNVTGDAFRVGSGAEELKISQQYQTLADFQRDVMAPVMSKLSLVQALSGGIGSMLKLTEDAMHTLSSDATAINQTFSAYGNMFNQSIR